MAILGIRKRARQAAGAVDQAVQILASANNAVNQQLCVANQHLGLVAGDARELLESIRLVLPGAIRQADNLLQELSDLASDAQVALEGSKIAFFELLAQAIVSIKNVDNEFARVLSSFEIVMGNANHHFTVLGGDTHSMLVALKDLLAHCDKYAAELTRDVRGVVRIAEINVDRISNQTDYVLRASKTFIENSNSLVEQLFQTTNREMRVICQCIDHGVIQATVTIERIGDKTVATLDAAKNFIDNSERLIRHLCLHTRDEVTVLLREAGDVFHEGKFMLQDINRRSGFLLEASQDFLNRTGALVKQLCDSSAGDLRISLRNADNAMNSTATVMKRVGEKVIYVLEAGEHFINNSAGFLKRFCESTDHELRVFLLNVDETLKAAAIMVRNINTKSGYVLSASESFIQDCRGAVNQLRFEIKTLSKNVNETLIEGRKVLRRVDGVLSDGQRFIKAVEATVVGMDPHLIGCAQDSRILLQESANLARKTSEAIDFISKSTTNVIKFATIALGILVLAFIIFYDLNYSRKSAYGQNETERNIPLILPTLILSLLSMLLYYCFYSDKKFTLPEDKRINSDTTVSPNLPIAAVPSLEYAASSSADLTFFSHRNRRYSSEVALAPVSLSSDPVLEQEALDTDIPFFSERNRRDWSASITPVRSCEQQRAIK